MKKFLIKNKCKVIVIASSYDDDIESYEVLSNTTVTVMDGGHANGTYCKEIICDDGRKYRITANVLVEDMSGRAN